MEEWDDDTATNHFARQERVSPPTPTRQRLEEPLVSFALSTSDAKEMMQSMTALRCVCGRGLIFQHPVKLECGIHEALILCSACVLPASGGGNAASCTWGELLLCDTSLPCSGISPLQLVGKLIAAARDHELWCEHQQPGSLSVRCPDFMDALPSISLYFLHCDACSFDQMIA